MSDNVLLDRLRAGQALLGLANGYPAAGIVEGMCAGWDFIWIDGQHGQHTYESAMEAIRTARGVGVGTVLRVPSAEDGALIRYLDADPDIVMIPMVNTAEQARRVARSVRFPPLGERSYGARRMVDLHGRQYPTRRRLGVMAQIETPQAVDGAEQIIGTEGIDVLFLGSDDLKMAAGIPIDTPVLEHPQTERAMATVAAAARTAGKFAACVAADERTLRRARELGYQLIAAGSDSGLLRSGAADRLAAFREAAGLS